jgi:endoglucanase
MLRDWWKTRSRRAALVVLVAMSLLGVSACGSPVAPSPPATDHALGWLHADGAHLLADDGTPQRIRAVSWFGLETRTCAPHGLATITVDAALAAMSSMGFNTVRLPFSSECLGRSTSTGINHALNPQLVRRSPLQVMDFVVERAAAHHLSVILDRHRLNSRAQSELWYDAQYPEWTWIEDWTRLARRYADDATVIGADLQNEPHGRACWGCGDPSRDWAAAATRAGNAILAVNPRWLVFVEGIERQSGGENTWWGEGLADARQHPIVLDRPGRVVYSPHAYPPSVADHTWFHDPDYPHNLPALWDRWWGYLQRENLAPVVLGEFGSRFQTNSDQVWMATMVRYLDSNEMGFAYWTFNPDSSDTGGLVKRDWVTPERAKLKALAPLFANRVSAPSTEPPRRATAAPVSTSPPASESSPAAWPTSPSPGWGSSRPGRLVARWKPQSSWAAGYVVNVTLAASGAPTSGWRLSWPDPQATAVQSTWGTDCRLHTGDIVCVGRDWGALVPKGGSVTVGVQVASTGGTPRDPRLSVTRRG